MTAGVGANSDATGPLNDAGTYEFWAVYSGDGNNNGSRPRTCLTETVIVDAELRRHHSTLVKNTNGTTD